MSEWKDTTEPNLNKYYATASVLWASFEGKKKTRSIACFKYTPSLISSRKKSVPQKHWLLGLSYRLSTHCFNTKCFSLAIYKSTRISFGFKLNTSTLNELCATVFFCRVAVFVHERDLIFQHRCGLFFVFSTASPPRAVHADVTLSKLKAFAAKNVEVDFSDHIGHGGLGVSQTAPKPERKMYFKSQFFFVSSWVFSPSLQCGLNITSRFYTNLSINW